MTKSVQLKRRIIAINKIVKVTYALRLISMSAHTLLKKKYTSSKKQLLVTNTLLQKISEEYPQLRSPLMRKRKNSVSSTLYIVVGSKKGLCGTFNTTLFKKLESILAKQKKEERSFIAIGKKVINYLDQQHHQPVVATYTDNNSKSFLATAHHVANFITNNDKPFDRVCVLSNTPTNFFLQEPEIKQIIPFVPFKTKKSVQTEESIVIDYLPLDQRQSIYLRFVHFSLITQLQHIFLASLLAEQAARFISMDSATKNAEKQSEETMLSYNKMRQSNITKELTELSGSL